VEPFRCLHLNLNKKKNAAKVWGGNNLPQSDSLGMTSSLQPLDVAVNKLMETKRRNIMTEVQSSFRMGSEMDRVEIF
jgi:hypothetical protein